jgi:C-terminal processing protease CtpA/Prc
MKGAFSLVALLITIFIVVYLFATYTGEVSRVGIPARDTAQQLSGRDASGMRASDSITLEAEQRGSSIRSVNVTGIISGGPMHAYYGLKVGDRITHVGGTQVSAFMDAEMARLQVIEGYQRHQELKVIRDEQELTLPVK